MAKKKPTQPGDMGVPVSFTKTDAQRIANVVHAYETSKRVPNPSKLPRAPGGGGSVLRLCQFTGQWPNEPGQTGSENVKVVTLYTKSPTSASPNAWIPEEDGEVVAINLLAYVPTPRGGPASMWGVVTKIASGNFTYGSTAANGSTDTLWLLVAAQC